MSEDEESREVTNSVLVPFLSGLVFGFSGAGFLGLTFISGMGTHVSRWGALVAVTLIASLIARCTRKYAKARPRQFLSWFALGVVLGSAMIALLDGICFGVVRR